MQEKSEKSRIFPTWEQIKQFKNPLTDGEKDLAQYLDDNLPIEWEIFVQPFLNGNRPDIVIMHPHIGMTIFEVKDWRPDLYHYSEEKFFVTDSAGTHHIPSPVKQVNRYRDNLVGLYVPGIGEKVDNNHDILAVFRVAIYFHRMTTDQARRLIPSSLSKYCIVFGYDELLPDKLQNIVLDVKRNKSLFMNKDWEKEIRFWLTPPFHSIEIGSTLPLNTIQERHTIPTPNKHQRLHGVAGSGKSMVLAQRAANLASQGKKVLIVTFNITLWHYIKDFVSKARANFSWERIEFAHFHGFCKDYLDENDIPWPTDDKNIDRLFNQVIPQLVINTVENGKNKNHRKYDAILIDEGQDFQKIWYVALCKFLSENNEVVLVADKRQNVYGRDLSWLDEMKGAQFEDKWRELKESYRLPSSLLEEANRFANTFFPEIGLQAQMIDHTKNQMDFLKIIDPHLIWIEVEDTDEIKERIVKAVRKLNKEMGVAPSDIVVLMPTHKDGWELVALFDKYHYKVNHVFEEDENKNHYYKKAFWMGDSRVKACTIQSFKGWEISNVIILTPTDEFQGDETQLDYLLYTAITRVRRNLIVYNRRSKYRIYGESWPKSW